MVEPSLGKIKQHLQGMDPYNFEKLVAEVWEQEGYQTAVSSGSGDEGIDIEATKTSPFKQKDLIQAKRYSADNKVGSQAIREYRVLYDQVPDVDNVIIVASSGFTKEAEKLADKLNVKLIDGGRLAQLIRKNTGRYQEYLGTKSEIANESPKSQSEHGQGVKLINKLISEKLRNSLRPLRETIGNSKYSTNSTLNLRFYDNMEVPVAVRITYLTSGQNTTSLKINIENRSHITETGLSVFRTISGIKSVERQSSSSATFKTQNGRLSTECEVISTLIHEHNPNFSEADEIFLNEDIPEKEGPSNDISVKGVGDDAKSPSNEEPEYSDKVENIEKKFDQYR